MLKFIAIFCCFVSISPFAYSQPANTKTITLEIRNVIANGGKLYVSVSMSEASYKTHKPDFTFEFIPTDNIIRQTLQLPIGEGAFNIYQDANNNGKLDTGIFGIPKEPVGISNWNGNGPPGNFKKHKTIIDTTTIVVNLYQM